MKIKVENTIKENRGGQNMSDDDEPESEEEKKIDWFKGYFDNYKFQVMSLSEELADEKSKQKKSKNTRSKINQLDQEYNWLKEHEDLLEELYDYRHAIHHEKWLSIKDDMEDFLNAPYDDELRNQLYGEYQAMIEDAREVADVKRRTQQDDSSVGGSTRSLPKVEEGSDDGKRTIRKEIEADTSRFSTLGTVEVGTVIEAKNMFDQWQATIVKEKRKEE